MSAVDLDPIPLADSDDGQTAPPRTREIARGRGAGRPSARWTKFEKRLANALTIVLCSLHTASIWVGMGGLPGLKNGWPLWRDDHPLYYHSALVTRAFLENSRTTAGYDPSFMAGYAKSVVFPASSTLPELAVALFGGSRPEVAYKVYVLVSAAAVPWLVALACAAWRIPPASTAIAVVLDLLYVWTDFPINYVAFGMLPYFLAIPLGLLATGAFARFLAHGGVINWLISTAFLCLAFLVHLTAAMVIVPAAAATYVALVLRRRLYAAREAEPGLPSPVSPTGVVPPRKLSILSHIAVWAIPVVVLTVNAFWWLPGIWLAGTKGPSDFAFVHREGVARRLLQIASSEAPIQTVLIGTGLLGLVVLTRRAPIPAWALFSYAAAGFCWGYLAGGLRALDFLQPGRHTYAFFTALAVSGGAGVGELLGRLRSGPRGADRLDRWVIVGLLLVGVRMIGFPGYPVFESLRIRFGPGEPFLSSRPSPRLLWVVEHVRRHVQPGERLLYEEGGFGIPGVPDPFQGGRFSGLLPERTGVEVIGGPYLHASLLTNFTQFGEGKLCGKADWGRADFIRYARLYGPSAILCWSPHAVRFCRDNPDLVRVLEEDRPLLVGRVVGFEGAVMEGAARVEAGPGRIHVREMSPGLDGSVVLRYHSVPYLTTSPSVACDSEYREDDPVPFIRLRPAPGTSEVELELHLPVGR
jgi:hypothetical protein